MFKSILKYSIGSKAATSSFATLSSSRSQLQTVVRHYSTTIDREKNELPKLKNILKQFYLKIHPDTLSAHPEEKKVNSHNMKIIMGIIDAFKRRPVPDPNTQQIPHALSFFIPDELEEGKDVLKRVDIEMIENCRNPNHVPDQLSKLFGYCNLATRFLTEIQQVDSFIQPRSNGSIKDFLLDNRHFAVQIGDDSFKQSRDLEMMLKKVRRELSVQVQMTVNPIDSLYSFQENYLALQEFADVYVAWRDSLTEAQRKDKSFTSLAFNLNHSEINYASNDPIIYLDRSSSETWASYLNRLDLKELADQVKVERDENAKRVEKYITQRKEFDTHSKELTKLLKVRSINWMFHDDPTDDPNHYLNNHDQMDLCLDFSKNVLIKNKNQITKLLTGKRFNRLTIGICPNLRKSKYYIDMDGVLKISTRVEFNEFIDIINNEHDKTIEVLKLSEKMETLRDYVQVRLGLKELTTLTSFVYTHGYDKVYQAYQKLYDESEKLRNLQLNGLTLVIADYYSISRAGEIFVKYDFSVEEFIYAIGPNSQQQQQQPIVEEQQVQQGQQEQQQQQ
ncbi:hypothetical protein DFA_04772 [Cavenderia fasciculata]|uniref:DUF4460 domain-containing protein n=1 Tax=Cavenderia fasciculata TaxID=261658 RepID=F4PQH9_CACFS|nr:uncharacterized protein DFA_04772 [Cavenderia fasciculata]EGG22642.1 hypothetical protein DFA_04772 [Cavenderia fasciculata]|eukprot:XP_004360493.1 hypothetical protein DFA_04772 [Cavenderia fasciculata]